ncbi:ABC transporter substrate-binding protein [Ralstonia pseudosolanacearum]|uniref:6,7-dimethyl-8-ribityllumazine synthase n=3 Tax=Ralstonia solanacearum species complex TaxID=3116862 RepID=A0A0S4U6G4_RALSL|nr:MULTISPECIES: ABC transporter substrate-binding protein [Ralstonia]APF87778.1 amino acid-binding protein [Ralstonia solanacearum FJAT-1458]ARS55474.1 amino acid-binding protein [Ralstonia solanacearum FJAT-91]AVV67851.1 amino acid-binding protein [Ralstonia solanacearum OE1-1]AXV97538.1 amino acid-binding protein [Ralstonia solanacearum]API76480.1 amino acid-binding protein [Ralstonia pseudosolanacearum]
MLKRFMLAAVAAVLSMRAAHADVITVAQVLPLDGSIAMSTRTTADAAELYLRRVNDDGGVNGHKFNVITVNATSHPETAVRRTAETIRQHHPAALLNYHGSARTSALIRSTVLNSTRTPVIGANVSSTPVRQDPNNHWVFYIRAGVQAEAQKMVRQAVSLGGRRVAILYQADAFGEDGMRKSIDVLDAAGIQPVTSISLSDSMMDRAALIKVAEDVLRANAGAILIFSDSVNVGGFLRAYRERGGNAVVTTDSTPSADELVRASSPDLARGVCIAEVLPALAKRNTRLVRSFVADMTAAGRPDLAKSTTALEGYVSARLFVEAVRKIAGPVTGETVRTALQSRGPFDLGDFEVRYGPSQYEGSQYVDIGIVGHAGRVLN